MRFTHFMCQICEVPLCTKLAKEDTADTATHFAKWHSSQQMIREAAKCHERLKKRREARRMNREEDGNDVGNDGSDKE